MSELRASIVRFRQEFVQNQRLRVGVMVIAGILAFYSFLVLKDWRAGLHENYVERRHHLRKLREMAGQTSWPQRAEAMARLRKALEAEIPLAASQGLAQASAQTWIRDLAKVHGTALQVESQAPQAVEGQPGLWRLPMVVTGSLPPKSLLNLIQQIEKRSSLSVIEEAMILNRENQVFRLAVVSYARVEEETVDAPR